MDIMIFCLLMAYLVKNGATDIIDGLHDRTPHRYVTAQKRADARIARARKTGEKYRAKAGRAPKRSTVRPYLKALWHDSIEDTHRKHDQRRTARLTTPVPEPSNVRVRRPDNAPAATVRPRPREDEVEPTPTDPEGAAVGVEPLARRTQVTPPNGHPFVTDLEHPEQVYTPEQGYQIREVQGRSRTHGFEIEDGDQLATVTPITEGIRPMTAPTTEVTGITSAIAWAEQTGESCTEAVTTVERLAAFFTSNEFDELGGKAAQMQEKFSTIAADCAEIVSELQRFLAVKEQWAAVDNQGTKEAIVNE